MSDDAPEAEAEPVSDIPNAADPKRQRRSRNKTRVAEDEAALFWRAVFADPVGRREMWAILRAGHTFEERFACGPNGFPQSEATWFEAGQQALGQRLWKSWLKMVPEGVVLMMQENDIALAQPKTR